MKNYLDRLGLERFPDSIDTLQDAIISTGNSTCDAQSLNDAEAVLTDPVVGEHYKRLHRQYEAMATAASLLEKGDAVNTHRWKERLMEFGPDSRDL
ncbi:MAG: hypothetical protein CSB44_04865 [Gammaproteobacteria bacterium]|nr:MAG: hypothetical protein CSB44_04865 [Gammaproteobacteria bacterium]